MHLNAADTDTGVIDQWIDREPIPPADFEAVLNHVHVYDVFLEVRDEAESRSLAGEIARAWEAALSGFDPRYRVVEYEGHDPEVTFHLDRGMSDTARSAEKGHGETRSDAPEP